MGRIKKSLAILLAVWLAIFVYGCEASPVSTYRMGSSGDGVREIQRRLSDWGYYKGSVDGQFGALTQDAVIAFQRKHKIKVDGIVGSQTAEKLGVRTPSGRSSTSGGSSNDKDVYLLAQLCYSEARGEPYEGMVGVAAVVLNRIKSSEFPNTMSKVIYQSGAFSVVDDGQINMTPNDTALRAARDALNGWDPTGGALFFYNPAKTQNKWLRARSVTLTIGEHVFCK